MNRFNKIVKALEVFRSSHTREEAHAICADLELIIKLRKELQQTAKELQRAEETSKRFEERIMQLAQ